MNYPRLVLAAIAALITFFAWGFLTEGWLLRKDFAASAALYRTSDLQVKFMPFGLASVLVALLAAVVIYARWCGATSGATSGLRFGVLMGIFVACIHPISNLITMNMDVKLGLEIAASNAVGWYSRGWCSAWFTNPNGVEHRFSTKNQRPAESVGETSPYHSMTSGQNA